MILPVTGFYFINYAIRYGLSRREALNIYKMIRKGELDVREKMANGKKTLDNEQQDGNFVFEEASVNVDKNKYHLNKMQRYTLFCSAIIILLMLLFPPFAVISSERYVNLGYGFIFGIHRFRQIDPVYANVNVGTLLIQFVGIVLITVILCFAYKEKD